MPALGEVGADQSRDQAHEQPRAERATVVDGEVTTVGTAAVRLAGTRLTAERGAGIDLLRAASAAIWSSGRPIYALDVAPELYS